MDIALPYSVILKGPTFSVIKVMLEHYLLVMQFKLDDSIEGKLNGDQKMTRVGGYIGLKYLWNREKYPPELGNSDHKYNGSAFHHN